MIILEIIHLGNTYPQGGASSILPGLIGAFIGSATSLSVFFLTTRRDKKKDNRSKEKNEINELKYFCAMIKTTILFGEKQSESYSNQANSIKAQPLGWVPLTKIINTDLIRILQKSDHQKIFHAYLNQIGNDSNRVENFRKIFSRIDYTYELTLQATESQATFATYLIDQMGRYKVLAEEEILNKTPFILKDMEKNDTHFKKNHFYQALSNIRANYHENAPETLTIPYLQNNFINPLKHELVDNFLNVPDGLLLADKCRKATWLYNETINKSLQVASDFSNFQTALTMNTNELRELTIELNNRIS